MCEPNIILGSLQIESLQLAPSVGKACALAKAVDRESPSITSSSPLLGATLRSVSSADGSRGFQRQIDVPHLG